MNDSADRAMLLADTANEGFYGCRIGQVGAVRAMVHQHGALAMAI